MKLLWKIFRCNIWNCAICFVSCFLCSAVLFLFEGIKTMLLGTMTRQEIVKSSLSIAINLYIYLLLFVGIILILYTMKNYSRIRMRDYGLFMVLGCKKSNVVKMIMAEYGIICFASFLSGCIVGIPVLAIAEKIMLANEIPVVYGYQLVLRNTFIVFAYIFAVFIIAVLLNLFNLRGNSLVFQLQYQERKTRIPSSKGGVIGTILGLVLLTIAAVLLLKQPMDLKRMKYGILFALAGVYLVFTYFGSLVLIFINRRGKLYYKHLLKIKNLFYRFSENKNIILLIFVIDFLVFVFINMNITEYSNTSSQYMWKYPYDLIWMTDQKYVDDIENFTSCLSRETKICPYKTMSSTDGGKYMGIPVSFYNEFVSGKRKVGSGEILAVMQKGADDEERMFQKDQVYLRNQGEVVLFQIKEERKEIPFIAQQSENIFILVMNDQDYQNFTGDSEDGNMVIMAQNLWQESKQIEHLQLVAQEWGAVVFSKNELMLQDRKEDIMSLVFYTSMGIFLIISNLTILAIKIWSEVPLLSYKYEFLKRVGMDEREAKRNVKSELSICLKIPFYLSAAGGILLLFSITRSVEKSLRIQSLIMFSLLTLLQLVYIVVMKNYGYYLIAKRIKNPDRRQ